MSGLRLDSTPAFCKWSGCGELSADVITLLTVIAGFGFKAWQDHAAWARAEATAKREREYDLADRQRQARRVEEKHELIVQKLDENTALTSLAVDKAEAAFTEANNFNRKWEMVERMFRNVPRSPQT